MSMNAVLRRAALFAALLGASGALLAAPPRHHADGTAAMQAQVKDSDAKIAAARAQNAALQAQVSQLEQQNAARGKQMQARDAEIAALQQKLQAVAGAPAASATAGNHP